LGGHKGFPEYTTSRSIISGYSVFSIVTGVLGRGLPAPRSCSHLCAGDMRPSSNDFLPSACFLPQNKSEIPIRIQIHPVKLAQPKTEKKIEEIRAPTHREYISALPPKDLSAPIHLQITGLGAKSLDRALELYS